MKQISIQIPARTVEIPLSLGSGSVLIDVPIPAGTVPVDEATVMTALSQVPVQRVISHIEALGYDVEKRADA